VTTLAEVLARHGPGYLRSYGNKIPEVQRQAIRDIIRCRDPSAGGHTWFCEGCQKLHFTFHSCNNRNCPQCQHHKAEIWLAAQQRNLLPVEYFMVTFTLPRELRNLAYAHQKTVFNLFFQTAAASLIKLGRDPRFLGGDLAMIGVLQTWARNKDYHPHIHFIVPGVALDQTGTRLLFPQTGFLLRCLKQTKFAFSFAETTFW